MSEAQEKYIVLLSTARSGSNWIAGLLRSSKKTRVYGELAKRGYLTQDRGAAWFLRDIGKSLDQVDSASGAVPRSFVEQAIAKCRQDDKVFGCKIFYSHEGPSPWIPEFVMSPSSMVIHLYRDRVFDTYTSLALAERTRAWQRIAYPDDTVMDFDEREYLEFRANSRDCFHRWRGMLADSKAPGDILDIEYSVVGFDTASEVIGSFLDLPDLKPPEMEKQRRRDVAAYWSNSDLVARYLDDTLTGS